MAERAVQARGLSIRLACEAFGISQTCYRYAGKRNQENDEIADWLLRCKQSLNDASQRGAVIAHGKSAA